MDRRAQARRAARIIKGVAGAAEAEVERFDQELRELVAAGRIAPEVAMPANREAAFELWQQAARSDEPTLDFVSACAGKFGASVDMLRREIKLLEPDDEWKALTEWLNAVEEDRPARARVQRLVGRLKASLALTAEQAQAVHQIVKEELARRA